MSLPKPECGGGYTDRQLEKILGDRLTDFHRWMTGQTVTRCEGRSCGGVAHGVVTYPWDLERFLDGRPIID